MIWQKLSKPLKIGSFFCILGLFFTLIGVARGVIPPHPLNILVALVLGGGIWFFVSWAIAAAICEVEEDGEEAGV